MVIHVCLGQCLLPKMYLLYYSPIEPEILRGKTMVTINSWILTKSEWRNWLQNSLVQKKWLKFCAMVKDVLNYGVFLSQPTRTLASSKYSLIKIT